MDRAGDVCGEGFPEVTTADVTEFVEDDHAESFGCPGEGGLGKEDGGVEKAGDDG